MGIRAKLILSTCIPLLILYVIVLTVDYVASSSAALETIEQLVAQRAAADAAQLGGRVMAMQAIADRVAYRESARVGGEHTTAATARPAEPSGPPDMDANRQPPDGRPPGEPPRGDGPPRGNDFRGGGGGGGGPGGAGPGGGLGGFRGWRSELLEAHAQSPWVSAVWFRFDPSVQRTRNWPEAGGFRHAAGEGRPVAFTPTGGSDAAWFTRPIADGRGVWLEPDDVHEPELGPVCVYAVPFFAAGESTPAGVACVAVPVDTLRRLRQDTPVQTQLRQIMGGGGSAATRPTTLAEERPPALAAGGYILLDRRGRILARPDGNNLGQELAVGPDDDELRNGIDRAVRGRGAIVVAGGLNRILGEAAPDNRYVLAMEQVAGTGWVYVTAQAEQYLVGPVQSRLIKRGLILATSLGCLVSVIALVLTRFCRPIEKMATRVHQLAAGDLDIDPVPVLANDELGQLASGFNDMTQRLRHHVRELTEQSAEREKVDSELRIARQIQSDLLPRGTPELTDHAAFALHAVNLPARHIAGDFFDYFFTEAGKLTVVIADVSGKGVPAALMMAVVRTMVRNLSETGQCPSRIADRINRMLVDDTQPGLFVTMILGQYEPDTGRFTYVNAGHPPAVSVTGGRASTCCEPTGPLLGVAIDELGGFEQAQITLAPGDAVLLYTDGVTEAHDETNVMFGESRLLDAVTGLARLPAPQLCEGVAETVMRYQHQSPADDLTLLCLQRR